MHVGADGTTSTPYTIGVSGPVFEDQRFEFIPIVECLQTDESGTSERRTYRSLRSRNDGKSLSLYIPLEYDNAIPHYDPDLENFTYSDPVNSRRGGSIVEVGKR